MSQLQKLYQSVQALKELNLPVSPELQAAVKQKETEIINTEIVPAVTESINAILDGIERDIVLETRYVPGKPLSVRVLRWTEVSGDGATRLEPAIPSFALPV